MGKIAVLSLFLFLIPAVAHAQDQDFASWLADLRREAVATGISPSLTEDALPDTLEPIEKVIKLDRKQPEGAITYEKYKQNVITPQRIAQGRALMQQHAELLKKVSETYKVEPQFIVALWGMETSYGRVTGGFETIHALATLAYEGRRAAFFRKELLLALKIVDEGNIPLHEMKGSWAGAMGQCQFMPTSYIRFAQDFDGDGKRDIWRSLPDVFASAAAYLSQSGWHQGEPWGRRVILPKTLDPKLMGVKVQKPIQFWREAGVTLPNGHPLPDEVMGMASLVQPGGEGYKAYIVYDNYRIITKWNASSYFATSVFHLASVLGSI